MLTLLVFSACDDPKAPVNQVPVVEILSHEDNETIIAGEVLSFSASVSDPDSSIEKVYTGWSVDGVEVCSFELVTSEGESFCETALEPGSTGISVLAQDPSGGQGTASIRLNVLLPAEPDVEITAPAGGQLFYSDVAIGFEGLITDELVAPEDLSVIWSSDLDGEFTQDQQPSQEGLTSATTMLSQGFHEVTLTAENTYGLSSSVKKMIEVGGPNQLPICTIVQPANDAVLGAAQAYQFWGNAVDSDIPEMSLNFVWTSNLDGELSTQGADASGNSAFFASLSPGAHTITMTAVDEVGGSCSAEVAVFASAAPEIVIHSPVEGALVNEGEVISLEVTIGDLEDQPSVLQTSLTSNVDGDLGSILLDGAGQGSLDFSLTPGGHVLTVTSTDTTGFSGQSAVNVSVNGLPTAPIALITPNPAYTNDDLVVSAYGSMDSDGDTVSYIYEWYKDAVQQPQTTSSISASDTLKGETWRVVVTAFDGTANGASNEASLTIQNSVPTLGSVNITPSASIGTNDTLVCSATANDADEVPSVGYVWFDDGVSFATGDTVDLSTHVIEPTSIVSCEVTATDSDGANVTAMANVEIDNAEPVIDTIVIDPTVAYADSFLTCGATAIDADNDTPTLSYAWFLNNLSMGVGDTIQLTPGVYSVGDTVRCTATAIDSYNAVVTESLEVQISNTLPVISAVDVNPETAYADSYVICDVTAGDLNDGSVNLTYVWSNDSTGLVLSTQPAIILTPNDVYPSDVLSCTATATDSNGGQASATSTTTIANSPPEFVDSPSITPATNAFVDMPLVCGATAVDLDGDPVSLSYSWEVDGVSVAVGVNFVPSESTTDVGSTITCVVAAEDGLGGITTESTDLVLSNTPPSISSVEIVPDSGVTSSTRLTCVVDALDADMDAFSTSYVWKNLSTNSTLGTSDSYLLRPQDGIPGNYIECSVTVTDVHGGADLFSTFVEIENTVPIIESLVISPDTDVRTDSALTCFGTASDPDNESVYVSYQWQNLSTGAVLGAGDSLMLDALVSSPGDEVSCVATATDETGGSSQLSTVVNIENTDPVISSIVISPSTGVTTSGTITCLLTATDLDGGQPSATYVWLNETTGMALGVGDSLILTPQTAAPNDIIRCDGTATDLDGGSVSSGSTIDVENTPPVVSGVSISPNTGVFADTVLSCSASAVDADNTGYSFDFEWTNKTTGLTFGTGSSVTLNPGWVYVGDEVECTAIATDTDGGVGSSSTTVVVENTPPTVVDVDITPSVGITTSSTLDCLGTGADLDGDNPTLGYDWHNQTTGLYLGVGVGLTLTPQTSAPGDVIVCSVTATDTGGATGVSSGTVTIENTPPTVDAVSISPNTSVYTFTTLTCDATASDVDGLVPAIDYTWENVQSGAALGSGASITLTSSMVSPLEEIRCVATATDLNGGTATAAIEVEVENTDPVVDSMGVSPNIGVTTSSNLTCTASASDVDGGTPSVYYIWTNLSTGSQLSNSGTFTLDPLDASPEDEIQCQALAVDAFGGMGDQLAVVVVENSNPVISDVEITPATAITTDSTLTCSGTVADPDGGVPFETFLWTNLTRGLTLGTDGTLDLDPTTSGPGEEIQCQLTATDLDGGSMFATANVFLDNLEPIINSITISPDPTYNDSTALCTVDVVDPDNESMTESYLWTNVSTGVVLGSTATLTFGQQDVSPSDEVNCSVTVVDASGGSVTDDLTIFIESRPPTIDSIGITPDSDVTTSSTLTCNATASDIDAETPSIYYSWSNGSNQLGTGPSLTLTSATAQPSDAITCTAIAMDASGLQSVQSTTVNVDNSQPVITSVDVLPTEPYTSSTLFCSVGYSDPDGQSMTVAYQWENLTRGTSLGSSVIQSLSVSVASPQDEIQCTATVTDASGDSVSDTGSVSILNRAPSLGAVTITPSTDIAVTSSLVCASSATDPDGETPTISYVWVNNGVTIGTSDAISLDATIVQPGDSINCVATAMDGAGATDTSSTLVSVDNTAPVISSVSITPDPSYNDTTLTCHVLASDVDGQSVSIDYLWKNLDSGASLGVAQSLTLNTSSASTNDEIQCVATVEDPLGSTDSDSTSILMGNRSPTMTSVDITPATGVTTASSLSCLPAGYDIDADVFTYGYEWTNDTVGLGTSDSLTLSPSTAQPSDSIVCTVTITDSNGASDVMSNSVEVDNTNPVVSNVAISPDPAVNNDILTCTVTASDADNQNLTTTYFWTNETRGTTLGTNQTVSLSSSLASVNDTIRCTGTVTDPSGGGDSSTGDVVITNRDPVISSVGISPDPAYNDSTLSCYAAASDADNQSITTTYTWTNETQGTMLGTAQNLTLSSSTVTSTDTIRCTATVTDPTSGNAIATNDVTMSNRAPVLGTVSISPSSAVTTSSTLVCSASGSDIDNDTTTLSYLWLNDTVVLGTSPTLTLNPSTTQPSDTIICNVTITDSNGATDTGGESVEVDNTEPVISSVGISPDPAYNNSTLSCSVSASDADSQSLSTTYIWTNVSQGTTLGTSQTLVLSSNAASVTDTIRCTASVTDPSGGGDVSVANIVMSNRAPVISSVGISPGTAYNNSTLSCSVTASDADSQSLSTTYIWTNVSQGTTLGTNQTLTLSSSSATSTDTVRCSATVIDPTGGVDISNSDVVMSNRSPNLSSVVISPGTGVTTSTTLSCSASGGDIDSDSTSITYQWSNNTTSLGSGSSLALTPSIAQPGNSIYCTATITDSNGASDSSSTSVTVENIDPVIGSIGITPGAPYNDSTLTCNVSSSDADSQSLSTTYSWTNGSSVLGSGSTLTLSSSTSSPGDGIHCTATVSDPSGGTDTESSTVVVSNRAPTLTGVAISPNTGVLPTSTLSCSGNASDADGQSVSKTYSWTNGSSQLGTSSNLTLSPSSSSPGDTVYCTITATDGSGASVSSSASVSVTNSPPVISGVSISPSTVYNNSSLTCSVSASDADGQSLSTSYAWTNASTGSALGTGSSLTLSSSSAQPGQTITCSVSVGDGITTTSSSASDTVSDRSPSISSIGVSATTNQISWDSSRVTMGDTLSCSMSASDPDGQSLSLTYAWYIGSISGSAVDTGSTIDLSTTSAEPNDVVHCVGTASNTSSVSSSASITLNNDYVILANDSTTFTSGTYTYDNIMIASNGILYIEGSVALVFDEMNLYGTINGDGGANNGGALNSSSTSSGGGGGSNNAGSGGGGYGGAGGAGGYDTSDNLGTGGSSFGDRTEESISVGGGAGGVSCAQGAAGGAAISIYVGERFFTGSASLITMGGEDGAECSDGRSTGGGAGGGIMIVSNSSSAIASLYNGDLKVVGGAGGVGSSSSTDGGGGGGGGRIKILDFGSNLTNNSGTRNYGGGTGGAYGDAAYGQNGGVGSYYVGSTGYSGQVRKTNGTWIDVTYAYCASNGSCTASAAKSACSSLGMKVVSHASNGTSDVYSLGASASCHWSISYYTVDQNMPSGSCLAGISNLEWSTCCGTSQWHGNTVNFGSVGSTFGYVWSNNSGYLSSNNSSGSTWGCQSETSAASNVGSCSAHYVACAN